MELDGSQDRCASGGPKDWSDLFIHTLRAAVITAMLLKRNIIEVEFTHRW